MTTRITVTIGDGGLVERNAQQQAANRQGAAVRNNANKATAAGTERRRLDRIAAGRNPETGAPLIPPPSATTLARLGSASTPGIPRLNQQVGASRGQTGSVEWNCTYADPTYSNDRILTPVGSAYASAFTCPFQKKGGKYPGSASALASNRTSSFGSVAFKTIAINNRRYLEAVPVRPDVDNNAIEIRPSIGLRDSGFLDLEDLTFNLLVNPRPIERPLGIKINTFRLSTSLVAKSPTEGTLTTFSVGLLDTANTDIDGRLRINYSFRIEIDSIPFGLESSVRLTATATNYDTYIYTVLGPPLTLNAVENFLIDLRKISDAYYITMFKDNTEILKTALPFPITKRDCKPFVGMQVLSRLPEGSGTGNVGSVLFGPLSVKFA